MTPDAYDRKILRLLQDNNRLSLQALAEQVNLSPSAIQRRITALEKSGMIRGHVALLDAAKARFCACAHVQQVYYVTGHADFLLILAVRDMDEYDALSRELFLADANIKRFRTTVVLDTLKYSGVPEKWHRQPFEQSPLFKGLEEKSAYRTNWRLF